MRAVLALAMNDLRSIRRDPFLLYVSLVPWVLLLFVRLVVPGVTQWLARDYGFNLVPYYPLIVSFFFILEIPFVFGLVIGFLLLDERDQGTLTALRVTPLSMRAYAAYRVWVAAVLSVVYTLITIPLTGLAPLSIVPGLVPVVVVAGLIAPVVALFLASFAGNKVEGLALLKASGLFIVGPMLAYFVHPPQQLLFGVLPTYWAAKAYWLLSGGPAAWPYLLAGLAYQSLLLALLLRRFAQRSSRLQ